MTLNKILCGKKIQTRSPYGSCCWDSRSYCVQWGRN